MSDDFKEEILDTFANMLMKRMPREITEDVLELRGQLLPFMLVSFIGCNPRLADDIDRLFDSKAETYSKLYLESEYFHDTSLLLYRTEDVLRIQKLAGILEDYRKNEVKEPLRKLLKKGYNKVYRYFESHPAIDGEELLKLISYEKTLNYHGPTVYDGPLTVAFFLMVTEFCRPIKPKIYALTLFLDEYDKVILKIRNIAKPPSENILDTRNVLPKPKIAEYRNKYGFAKAGNNIQRALLSATNTELESLPTEFIGNPNSGNFEDQPSKLKNAIKTGNFSNYGIISRKITYWLNLARYFNVSDYVYDVMLTDRNVLEIFSEIEYQLNLSNIDPKLKEDYVIGSLFLIGLAREYHKNKHDSVVNEGVATFSDALFQKKDSDFDVENNELVRLRRENDILESKLQSNTNRYKELNKRLEKELRRLHKENKRLTTEVDLFKDEKQELFSLREFAYSLKSDFEMDDVSEFEENKKELATFEITIFGGTDPWRKQMQKLFPDFHYVLPNKENTDISFITQKDMIVFFNTHKNSHGMYYKVQKLLSNIGKPIHYLNESGNIERTVATMLSSINKR